jgi:hypothetical protein
MVSTTYNYSAANREDLRGGKKMGKSRVMPTAREATRNSAKAEADSLGAQHMAVAANKARANLARGQAARGMQQKAKSFFNNINPFRTIAKTLGD